MPPPLVVSDTHALIWYAQGRTQKLGPAARRVFERCASGQAAVYVPALVLAELSEAARCGRVALPGGFLFWTAQLFASGRFVPVGLTWEILRRAESLYAIPERGDRLIAATAAQLDAPLLTRDPEIGAAAGVEVIW
ncbi:MAG TPA: PIN domain-containing protein [Longimicrobium sp.]|nr:PIN domain-containing protein [Longimicrobium sp.]